MPFRACGRFFSRLLLQLTFQTFTTWYAFYGTGRFGLRPNAYPLFVEPIPRHNRGVLAALFLLCMAGGAIGDPLNGALFDLFDATVRCS